MQVLVLKTLQRSLTVVCLAAAAALTFAVPRTIAQTDTTDGFTAERNMAFSLIREGRWREADIAFESLLKISSEDELSLYGSAVSKFNFGDVSGAAVRSAEAIQLLEVSGENPGLLADCLVLSAIVAARSGANLEAVTKLKRAIELVPDHFDATLSLARALYGGGDVKNAAVFFKKAVELQPNNTNARFFLATTLEKLGEFEDALNAYRTIIAAAPDDVKGNLGLGVLLLKLDGDGSAEGVRALEKVIAKDGSIYEARIELGKLQLRKKLYKMAIGNLEVAALLKPGNPEPYYQLSIAYRRLGMKDEAEKAVRMVKSIHESRRVVEKDPD